MTAADALACNGWPLIAIDFEASSLGSASYPIEVGVAVWRGHHRVIEGWSTLIRPTATWAQHGHWSAKSEAVHGISRDQLVDDQALAPKLVVERLNAMIGEGIAWCDGGDFDQHWQEQLLHASGIAARWSLRDVRMLRDVYPQFDDAVFHHELAKEAAIHRAGDDAMRLLLAIRAGLSLR